MISSDPESAVTSISVILTMISGHIPAQSRQSVSNAAGMRRLVTGIAIRLVSRKCLGKELKYKNASGPVVSWHESDNAADDHIFLKTGHS